MTADGTKVYFTTADQLTGDDTDSSADIYRADVGAPPAHAGRVSTGEGGTGRHRHLRSRRQHVHAHWNSLGAQPNCDVLAVGGGGGVASGDGSVYFLSPGGPRHARAGKPAGRGRAEPLRRPARAAPHFIRALESSANAPIPVAHPFRRTFGSFGNAAGVGNRPLERRHVRLRHRTTAAPGRCGKFDSSGHSVLDFATNGQLDRRRHVSAS